MDKLYISVNCVFKIIRSTIIAIIVFRYMLILLINLMANSGLAVIIAIVKGGYDFFTLS